MRVESAEGPECGVEVFEGETEAGSRGACGE